MSSPDSNLRRLVLLLAFPTDSHGQVPQAYRSVLLRRWCKLLLHRAHDSLSPLLLAWRTKVAIWAIHTTPAALLMQKCARFAAAEEMPRRTNTGQLCPWG